MVIAKLKCPNTEPETIERKIPSEKEHLFYVVDVFTCGDKTGRKMNLDDKTVMIKCEVVGGEEEGRSLLLRIALDETDRGFFMTRLFCKAIGLPYHGDIVIDTDMFINCQFFATVKHNNGFANIKSFNFEKLIKNERTVIAQASNTEIAWDDNM